jgi:DNA-binding response OmpR family regulator
MSQRILLAEDEEHIQKMVINRLKSKGYKTMAVNDGEEAMKKMPSFRPDLLILDLTMPKKNGYQVCKEVRADSSYDHIPIIILSAWVRDKVGENDGLADVYIAKPFDAEELLAEVHQLLNYGRDLK